MDAAASSRPPRSHQLGTRDGGRLWLPRSMPATARRTSGPRASTIRSRRVGSSRIRSLTISHEHIYADQAQSGARSDRPALAALMAAARGGEFDVVLLDDLSRFARDNHLMLSIIAELHFEGIRVISVADGVDSTDEESWSGSPTGSTISRRSWSKRTAKSA